MITATVRAQREGGHHLSSPNRVDQKRRRAGGTLLIYAKMAHAKP